MKSQIELVVFDMAGTTVKDEREVENCFYDAAILSGLEANRERINDMMGLPKLVVVETLWSESIGKDHVSYKEKVMQHYDLFKKILEQHYIDHPISPTEGTLATFEWLRSEGIKIALTTGFYRKVANIILQKLGWEKERFFGFRNGVIDLSLTPDETQKGRPYPDMIWKAQALLNVSSTKKIIKIGDTPADLQAGKAANCRLVLGVTNGTHTHEQLSQYENDGLLPSMEHFRSVVESELLVVA
ncbi:MAG: HAD hydrolase-like protein [Saprospiraceae bacterium]|nr:HAD hydrolase-like protein [Saprospiraceae bacterium]